jgi:non-ribosomal peptide synthetase component E (peptide arylation enzyme)
VTSPKPEEHICEHPECQNAAIVGINDHYVCAEHVEWAFQQFVPNPKKMLNELIDNAARQN